MIRTDLEQAYRGTTYQVDAPGGRLDLRIGQLSPELDRLLEELGAREWAFITAYNPRSEQVGDEENETRHKELVAKIDELGLRHFPARGVDDDGSWPTEHGLFIAGIPESVARGIARDLEQNAIVTGSPGGAPELVQAVM